MTHSFVKKISLDFGHSQDIQNQVTPQDGTGAEARKEGEDEPDFTQKGGTASADQAPEDPGAND